MKKAALLLALVALPLATMSCASGPRRLSRTWDNYVNQKYSEDALIHGLVLQDVIPAYGIVGLFAAVGDAVILNPYYFWSRDIWEGNGTAFDYTGADGALNTVGKWPAEKSM